MRIRGAGCGWPPTLSFPKIISARCGSLYGQLPSHKGHLLWKIRDANYLIDNKAGIIVDAEGTRANRADEISSPKPWSSASNVFVPETRRRQRRWCGQTAQGASGSRDHATCSDMGQVGSPRWYLQPSRLRLRSRTQRLHLS